MSTIGKINLNLSNIDKSKIFEGKKGKYLPITFVINDEKDDYGNDGPVYIEQTKEEREAKADKVYLGSTKIVWTSEGGAAKASSAPEQNSQEGGDLPF